MNTHILNFEDVKNIQDDYTESAIPNINNADNVDNVYNIYHSDEDLDECECCIEDVFEEGEGDVEGDLEGDVEGNRDNNILFIKNEFMCRYKCCNKQCSNISTTYIHRYIYDIDNVIVICGKCYKDGFRPCILEMEVHHKDNMYNVINEDTYISNIKYYNEINNILKNGDNLYDKLAELNLIVFPSYHIIFPCKCNGMS